MLFLMNCVFCISEMAYFHQCINEVPIYQLKNGWHSWFLTDDDSLIMEIDNADMRRTKIDGESILLIDASKMEPSLLSTAQYKIHYVFKYFRRGADSVSYPHKVRYFNPLDNINAVKVKGGDITTSELNYCTVKVLIKGITGKLQMDGSMVFKPILKLKSAKPQPKMRAVRNDNAKKCIANGISETSSINESDSEE